MPEPVDIRDIDLTAEEFLRLQVQNASSFDDPDLEYEICADLSIDSGATFLMQLVTTLQGTARAKDDSLPFIEYPAGMNVWDPELGESKYWKFNFAHVEIFSNKPPVAGGLV